MSSDPAESLSYGDLLPLSWAPLSEDLSEVALAQLGEGNVAVLNRLASLEERPGRKAEEDEVQQAISQLSNKLDLLIEMVAALARERQPLPPAVEIGLSAHRLSWIGDGAAPSLAQRVLVSLYLNPGLAPPLRLPARVERIDGARVTVRIEHPSEASLSMLEQHVFLHHRRAVAESRKQQGGGAA